MRVASVQPAEVPEREQGWFSLRSGQAATRRRLLETPCWRPIDRPAHRGVVSDTPMRGASTNSLIRMNRLTALAAALLPMLILAVWVSPLHAGLPVTQKHERRHEIDHLEEAWRTAVLNGNTAAMEALLADDYMAITASGTLQTKDQVLANLRSGRTHIKSLDISDRKVRFYGTTALVTSLAEVQGTNAEGDFTGSFRYTRVYVRNAQGEWKIVSFEASRILKHGEPK